MAGRLDGVAALTKQLIALGKLDDGKVLKKAVKNAIQQAYKRAEATIPVGLEPHNVKLKTGGASLFVAPGFAKKSLRTISTINAEKNIASGILSVRKAAYYAVQFVELGTSKYAAEPWLRPAFYEARAEMEQALKDTLVKGLEKAIKDNANAT